MDQGDDWNRETFTNDRYPKMFCVTWGNWGRGFGEGVSGDTGEKGEEDEVGKDADKEEEEEEGDKEEGGIEKEERMEEEDDKEEEGVVKVEMEEEVEVKVEMEEEVEVRSGGRCDAVVEIDGVCVGESGDGDRVSVAGDGRASDERGMEETSRESPTGGKGTYVPVQMLYMHKLSCAYIPTCSSYSYTSGALLNTTTMHTQNNTTFN